MTIELNKSNFAEEIKGGVVLLDFWAPWCGPCKMLSPVLEEISSEMSEVKFCKINVDNEADLASEYNVNSIPALFILKNGEKVDQFVGALPKSKIIEKLKKFL